ncbi:hypothetical protein C8F04DRAFT_1393872 [Mycena alexandri]|uniref:Uncharacterized protein n=1 Tax=Mycena alexandri TaxID=1745969 RepID=A0AAD6T0H6_9AGAR|nr:hypothetical protein C8F04DRAFT_1393872 [Mycena alexandri]
MAARDAGSGVVTNFWLTNARRGDTSGEPRLPPKLLTPKSPTPQIIVPWPVRLVLNETEEPEAVAERVPTLGVVDAKTIAGLFRSQILSRATLSLVTFDFCSGITRHIWTTPTTGFAQYTYGTSGCICGQVIFRSLASSAGDASDNKDDDDVTTLVLRAARNTPSTTRSLANLSSQPRFISPLERSISFMTSPRFNFLPSETYFTRYSLSMQDHCT